MKKFLSAALILTLVAGCCCKKNKVCQEPVCQQEESALCDESLQEERVSGVLNAKEVGWTEADYQ